MSKKKLITISRNSENGITFYFDDSTKLAYEIRGDERNTFLYYPIGHNAEVFRQLDIRNPHSLYKELGILAHDGGDCPECKREDLDKVINYLLEHYSAKPKEESSKPKEPSEWDWLLD